MTTITRIAAATRAVVGTAGPLAFNIPAQNNVDLRAKALAAGWDGVSAVTATTTGYIGSTSIGSPAMTIAGSFPGGVTLVNSSACYIAGKGGNSTSGIGAQSGGPALSVTTNVTIVNNGIIGGGGGGGAINSANGMAGGGGAGLNVGISTSAIGNGNGTLTNGGPGGGVDGGAVGQNGVNSTGQPYGGGGGGLGGAGGSCDGYHNTGHTDATVGDSDPDAYSDYTGGGAAGAAVLGNANVTWVTTGTRYGPLNS